MSEQASAVARNVAPQHTPGPWVAKEDRRRWVPNFIEGERAHIADVIPCRIDKKNDDEARANARLIAAAPKLLEALRRAIADELGDNWKADARAAIAKATGQ